MISDAADRPRPHLAGPRRLGRFHRRVVLLRRQRGPVVRLAAGAVEDDVVAPVIEDVAVRVGEVHRDVGLELERPRLEAEHAAVGLAHRRPPRRLDLGVMEDAFLEVQRAAGIEREAVHRVVRVGRVQAAEDDLAGVGLVVAVGVLEEHQVRRLGQRGRRRSRTRSRWDCSDRRRTPSACRPCRRRRCLRGSGACRSSASSASSADSSARPPPRAGRGCRRPSAPG